MSYKTTLPLVASLAALLAPVTAGAVEIAVTTTADVINGGDGVTSLREALIEADAAVVEYTIIVPAGTYTLSAPDSMLADNQTGDLDILGVESHPITIRGAGVGATIIDPNHLDRAFQISGERIVTIERMTIRNGKVQGGIGAAGEVGGSVIGGGIVMNANIDLVLRDVIIEDCEAAGGAGGDASAVSGAGIINGSVGGAGGTGKGGALGIDVGTAGSISLQRVGFYRNIARGGAGGAGGDAHSTDNSATAGAGGQGGLARGGALYLTGLVKATYEDVVFEENSAQGGTGGAGGIATTDVVAAHAGGNGGMGNQGAGGAVYGTSSTMESRFLSVQITNNIARGGNGGLGGYGQQEVGSNGISIGGSGGGGGPAYGGGILLSDTARVYLKSGLLKGNSARGGNGGDAIALPPSSIGSSGSGGAGGASRAGAYYSFGEAGAMYTQVDNTWTVDGNSAIGGNGGNGADAINTLEIGNGGNGGAGNYPGMTFEVISSLSRVRGGAVYANNIATGGSGGAGGSGGIAGATGSIISTNEGLVGISTTFYTVSGRAWADQGGAPDGIRSGGEPLLPDVGITMRNGSSQLIVETETSRDAGTLGTYTFETNYTAASTLKFDPLNFDWTGFVADQDIGMDDSVDSDIASDGTLAITLSGNMPDVDAGYKEPGPIPGSFTLTLTGKVSADVTKVSIGSTIVNPTNGTYTISVTVPASTGAVELVTTSSTGAQTKRNIRFDNAVIPPG